MGTTVKRITDLAVVSAAAVTLAVPMVLIALMVRATSAGPVIYYGTRVGRHGVRFLMPKFRTMRHDAPSVPSHELADADQWLTPVGVTLRRYSLDEFPQLWSVLKGDMSLVGPRPAHPTQGNLIDLRRVHGIDQLTPGVTGWAQVNGRDTLDDEEKVALDVQYLERRSWMFDLRIILRTIPRVVRASNVSH